MDLIVRVGAVVGAFSALGFLAGGIVELVWAAHGRRLLDLGPPTLYGAVLFGLLGLVAAILREAGIPLG